MDAFFFFASNYVKNISAFAPSFSPWVSPFFSRWWMQQLSRKNTGINQLRHGFFFIPHLLPIKTFTNIVDMCIHLYCFLYVQDISYIFLNNYTSNYGDCFIDYVHTLCNPTCSFFGLIVTYFIILLHSMGVHWN